LSSDGTLIEIGNPWFDNTVANDDVNSPHGVATDLNGFVYIGESNVDQEIRKFTCDGEIVPESEFAIANTGQFNMGSIGNFLYANARGADDIRKYDVCTGNLIATANFCEAISADWGFYIDPRTEIMYTTTSFSTKVTDITRVFVFTDADFDNDASTCISAINIPPEIPTHSASIRGITTDTDGNLYIVIRDDKNINGNPSYVVKLGPAPTYAFIASSAYDFTNGDGGYNQAVGIVYSESADRLYVSTESKVDDCISLFDTDLNYLGAAVPASGSGDNGKGIAIIQECCPTNNNLSIDTTLCAASIGDLIFLQELIDCEGVICEGLWAEGASNTGLNYNSCNNLITIDATTACGSFTLESDGTGNFSQCGAFKITINIQVELF